MKGPPPLAPIVTASFLAAGGAKWSPSPKRYSGKREKASKKERKLENEGWKFTIIENKNLLNNVRLELLRRIRFLQ
ncbi:hypothetical protein [Chryseobacterium hispalense]|uniref:hypothetical protein n=1 Tax=Chryseobacterium hispalense TaxID=1453492 RepID=UPI0039191897